MRDDRSPRTAPSRVVAIVATFAARRSCCRCRAGFAASRAVASRCSRSSMLLATRAVCRAIMVTALACAVCICRARARCSATADSSAPTVSLRHDAPATQYIVASADAAMSNVGTAEANTEEVAAGCGTMFSDMVMVRLRLRLPLLVFGYAEALLGWPETKLLRPVCNAFNVVVY